ncbi:galactokinase [Cavenderia fasciculata]|uniref:Galactokinase n=1 Tax=Cavenderia fasciculata TaxID=261658 RepID=F4PLY8_CACFS|nr:galactokinase [Cavenderia fasciculata]EGG23542.1 galactokinase [Cavenderia fasciculata]|eukprot:XP_004361393.1 galactokinase [Cavenderia fasciculata]
MDIFNPHVPAVFSSIDDVYFNRQDNEARYNELSNQFQQSFDGDKPMFYFRAPGRVNLIGEHVDYSGYPVLPFALQQDVIVACNFNSKQNSINIRNCVDKYTPKSINVDQPIVIDPSNHHWTNYVLAAIKGVQDASPSTKLKGMNLLFSGNVPAGSGVSSSSALVCVSTLTISYTHNLVFTKDELANISVKCERYVGVEGGGMDQAISYLAEENTAKLIEFNPLRTNNVVLPKGVSFVISNSLVESNKVVTGAFYYNLRVTECRLAAVVLANKMGLQWEQVRKLNDVQKLSNLSLQQLLEMVDSHLHQEAYTRQEVANILGVTVEQLVKSYFPSGVTAESFQLHRRASHVYSETSRVYDFQSKCQESSNGGKKVDGAASAADHQVSPSSSVVHELGKLMDSSHFSCSQSFECSCPELDRLTDICRKAGAYGSRLTGAGWGGCVISLVPSDRAEEFMATLERDYYSKIPSDKLPQDRSSYLFCTNPSKGACILSL